MTGVVLAANNAEIGGGEVMLLATARVLRDLGVEATIVGPGTDGGVLDEGEALGFPVHRLPTERQAYLARLRGWAANRPDWIWCHGLVPALATTGRRRRIVHLHQAPAARHRPVAAIARRRAEVVLVPSHAMAALVPGAEVLWNWTEQQPQQPLREPRDPVRVGFIGRHSRDKGLDVLARAIADLDAAEPGRWRLVLAGDSRFVPPEQVGAVTAALEPVAAVTDRLGWCSREEFLDAADVAAFPSTWPEPFGLVAAEAMSAGIPLVVSDAGALPEVVGPEHPWVCAAGDAAALADALRACVEAPAPARAAAVDAAHRRWTDHFSPAAGRVRTAALLARLGIIPPDTASDPR